MKTTEKINIDTVTPSSMALLTDQRQQVVLQHGGAVTRISFNEVYVMSVDDFIKHEVPKIAEAHKSDELRVLRDANTQQLSVLYGDQVIQYKVDGLDECPLNQLVELLKTRNKFVRFFNFAHPLVGYVEEGSFNIVTVYLEAQKRDLRFAIPSGDFSTTAYLPPLWFRVSLNQANSVCGSSIAAVPERTVRAEDTPLKHVGLPNIGGGGSVCFGSSQLTSTGYFGDSPTMSQAVEGAIMQFFGAAFNLDLLSYVALGFCDDVYESLPKIDTFEKKRVRARTEQERQLLKLLRIYQLPGGWKKLRLPPLQVRGSNGETPASEFLGGRR